MIPNTAAAMLYLCGCVLTDTNPDPQRFADVSLQKLYEFSQFHSLTALVCEGLERAGVLGAVEEAQAQTAFRQEREKSVRKNLMLDMERAKLLTFLEQQGIWYMPLKGVILKDMYPKMGLRQMSDNDILFDPQSREAVRDWFAAAGYTVIGFGTGVHDIYHKEPVYNYEMHVSLYGEMHRADWQEYFRTVKERLVKDPGNTYGYHFTDEDFYVYFLSHGCKHFHSSGTGVRFLMDMYVYRKHRQSMDFAYIHQELRKLGLEDFERDCLALTTELFRDMARFDCKRLGPEQQELLLYLLHSGTYGTLNHRVEKAVNQYGKYSYFLQRIFPGTKTLQTYHPIFRHKWLMPVGWIYRAVRILSGRAGYALKELRLILNTKRNNT